MLTSSFLHSLFAALSLLRSAFDLILANRLTFILFPLPVAKRIHFNGLHCNEFFSCVHFFSFLKSVSVGTFYKALLFEMRVCSLEKSAFNLKWFKQFTATWKATKSSDQHSFLFVRSFYSEILIVFWLCSLIILIKKTFGISIVEKNVALYSSQSHALKIEEFNGKNSFENSIYANGLDRSLPTLCTSCSFYRPKSFYSCHFNSVVASSNFLAARCHEAVSCAEMIQELQSIFFSLCQMSLSLCSL